MKKLLFIVAFVAFCSSFAHAQSTGSLAGRVNILDTNGGVVAERWKKMYDFSVTSADDTSISTTLTATHNSVTIGAGELWHFDFYSRDSVSANTGEKKGYSLPVGATITGFEVGAKKSLDSLSGANIIADTTGGNGGATFFTYVPTTNYGIYESHFNVDNTSGSGGPVKVWIQKPTSGKAIQKKGAILLGYRIN